MSATSTITDLLGAIVAFEGPDGTYVAGTVCNTRGQRLGWLACREYAAVDTGVACVIVPTSELLVLQEA